MQIRLAADAEDDLDKIKDYLKPRSQQGLERVLCAIFTTIGQLQSFPLLGHNGQVDGTYETVIPHTPFFIRCSLPDRILHGRQKYLLEV
ncbi:MAG: type II toxin-antitoxin system RelE/ParE family toxin [Rhizobiaceae bacterium]